MIVDSSVLFAAADSRHPAHAAARDVVASSARKWVTDAILAETDYLIIDRLGSAVALAFLEAVDDVFAVEPSTRRDRARARELHAQYEDARLGYTDALSIAIAERLGERTVATLDRRHFAMVRPSHVPAFTLIP